MDAGDGRVRSRGSVVAACLVCQMGLGLGGYVFAVFLKPIVAELGWSRTAFGGSGGPFLLTMGLAGPIVGAATERFGARGVFSTAITVVAGALVGLSLPGGVLGPLFAAWMFDTGRGYWNAFAVFAAGNALAVVLVSRLAIGRSDHQAAVR